jgi:hypothetical protein
LLRYSTGSGWCGSLLVACGWLALSACGSDAEGVDPGAPASSERTQRDAEGGASRQCADELLASSDENVRRETAHALEIASLAAPGYALGVEMALVDPAYDFSQLDIEERKAQLAPSQERVSALVEQAGGMVQGRGWLANTLSLELPAERLDEAFCWPDVELIEVATQYWDVVTPPWDGSSVGTQECPVIDGACPEHCAPLGGLRFDETRACVLNTSELLTCARERGAIAVTTDVKCFASGTTGALYWAGGFAPAYPEFLSFAGCTAEDRQRVVGAPRCED